MAPIREGTFLIGGVGRGILEMFLEKKVVALHFPDWINAWPFTNT